MAEATPYWAQPGTVEGRIEPAQVTAQELSHVFALGGDYQYLPEFILNLGDVLEISQSFDVVPGTLIRFAWRMRSATTGFRGYRKLVDVGPVDVKSTALLGLGDGLMGVDLGAAASTVFTQEDQGAQIRLSGFTDPANNAIYRISAVPCDQGAFVSSPAGRYAIVEGALVTETAAAATVEVLGYQWRAQVFFGTSMRAELIEPYVQKSSDGWQRGDFAIHLSKYTGTDTLTFRLRLEATDDTT